MEGDLLLGLLKLILINIGPAESPKSSVRYFGLLKFLQKHIKFQHQSFIFPCSKI